VIAAVSSLAQGPAGGDAQPEVPAAADQSSGDGERPQPQAFGFVAARRAIEGEHLHRGEQFAGQRDDLAPGLLSLRRTSRDVNRQISEHLAGIVDGPCGPPSLQLRR
jgi:hypothetical protein